MNLAEQAQLLLLLAVPGSALLLLLGLQHQHSRGSYRASC
jgi:hypothetical protein